jgi:hypothetical protein
MNNVSGESVFYATVSSRVSERWRFRYKSMFQVPRLLPKFHGPASDAREGLNLGWLAIVLSLPWVARLEDER